MEGFKSADSRLVRLFNNSREKWKKRAAEKQKKMRGMEIKVRDLSASRELWLESVPPLIAPSAVNPIVCAFHGRIESYSATSPQKSPLKF
jgi:hypothetical protein